MSAPDWMPEQGEWVVVTEDGYPDDWEGAQDAIVLAPGTVVKFDEYYTGADSGPWHWGVIMQDGDDIAVLAIRPATLEEKAKATLSTQLEGL